MSDDVKKGQLLVFTHGEYDSYLIESLGKAITDFNVKEAEKKWRETFSQQYSKGRKVKCTDFIQWLIDNKYTEKSSSVEIYVGDGSKLEVNSYVR